MARRLRRSLSCNSLQSNVLLHASSKPRVRCRRSRSVKIEFRRTMANGEDQQQAGASTVPSPCAFVNAAKYQKLMDHFRLAVQKRENCVFSGSDAINILEEYLQVNREHFSTSATKRENALKVLETWLRGNVIRPANSSVRASPPLFTVSEKVMYTMNPERDHKLDIYASSLNNVKHVDKRQPRTNCYKPSILPSSAESADENAPEPIVFTNLPQLYTACDDTQVTQQSSKPSSFFKLTSHLLNSENRSIDEEAELHDIALCRLLTIVDIPVLEELIAVPGQQTRSSVILSTMLSKIGLGCFTAGTISSKNEEMDDLLLNTPRIRPMVPWFQIARVCAPSLYFQSSGEKPDIKEIHKWAKLALDAVSERYALITHRGSSPLIPTEYAVVLDAIVEQLLGKNQQKTKLALQYLCLMIPQQMRDHLSNVVQFLEKTTGTDEFVSLRGLYYLGIMGDNDNFRIALNELRCSIFPQTIELCEQKQIIKLLIEFRKEGIFGKPPEEMQIDLKALRGNATKGMMSIRFCAAESSVENFDAEVEIASTLTAIIDDFQISPAEKQKKCELFKQQHPRIYRKYFAHFSW